MKLEIRMSVIDLVVLGFLLKEPMNAYALAKLIEQKKLERLLKISRPAVYKSCKRLRDANLLKSKILRESEAPEKIMYTVNSQGKKHFYKLMQHFSSRLNTFHFESNSFIWNLYHCDYKEGLTMLRNFKQELVLMSDWLQTHEREDVATQPFCVRMVVKQYRMVLIAMVNWIDETIDEYIERGGAL